MIDGEEKIFIYVVSVMIIRGIIIYFGYSAGKEREMRNSEGS